MKKMYRMKREKKKEEKKKNQLKTRQNGKQNKRVNKEEKNLVFQFILKFSLIYSTSIPSHFSCTGSWGCRMYHQLLCKGVRPVMLELWGIRSTLSLQSIPGSLWPRVVASDRVLSMGQIELNCVLMLNRIVWKRTVLTFKLRTYAELNCLKWNYFLHWNYTYAKLNCLK